MSFVLAPQRMAGELRRRPTPGPYSRPLVQPNPEIGGGATPFLRGEVSGFGSGTAAITLTLPVTTQVGDTIVLIQKNDWYTLAALAAPTGTAVGGGWVEKTDARYDGGTNANHTKVWVGTVTTGGASTVISNWASPSGGDEERYGQALVFIGAATYDVGSTVAATAGTSWTAPSVNAGTAGSYLLVSAGTDGTAGVTNFTFPGSMTPLTEADVNVSASYRSAYELLSSSGATGTRTVTLSNSHAGDVTSLVVAPVPTTTTYQGAVTLSIGSTLTADGALEAFGAVDLTATATLTVTPPPIAGAVSLTTSQTLSVAGAVSQPGSTTLIAGSSLTIATPVLGAAAAVSLVSVKTLSIASPALIAVAAVSLIGSGGLSVAGIRTTDGAVALTATPTLSTIALLNEFAAVSLTVAGTLSVTGRLGAFGAVSLPAVGVLTVTVGGVGGAAALTTAQSLSAGAALIEVATVSLSAVSALSTSGIRTTAGLVTLSAVPVLTAGVTVGITNGSATLTALSSLTAGGIRITSAAVVPLVAASGLNVNGSTGSGGGANLAATTTLVVAGVTVRIGTTQLTALPSLVVSGIAVEFAAVVLTATGVLSVNGARVGVGSVSLVSVGLLLASAAISLAGAVNLVALPNLVFIELFPTVDVFAIGDWTVSGPGLHRDRPPYERVKSGWTTAGIHVGSVRS